MNWFKGTIWENIFFRGDLSGHVGKVSGGFLKVHVG